MAKRIGVFGWGIVAPHSPNIAAFRHNLGAGESWLTPFNGFGADNFLVGRPAFDFGDYRPWINERFLPRRFAQLEQKMDLPSLYAIGAFVQALDQNAGLEAELQRLGARAHVYVGSGLGNIGKLHDASLALDRAQRTWDRFWADPRRNSELRRALDEGRTAPPPVTPDDNGEGEDARRAWQGEWARQSPELAQYLTELAEIESLGIADDIDVSKLRVMRTKEALRAKLREKWGTPDPPWLVTADVVWNIHNTPAAQISMLGRITGMAFAPAAACSTFGVALRLAMGAIRSGDATAVVVGATDPPPHPLVVGAFYSARVLAADHRVSLPLSRLQGTHVSGGAVVWIVADYDHMVARGFTPLGMEPIAVGVSSDAQHIITPSVEGPTSAIEQALHDAGVQPADIATWDLHATATPGDFNEIRVLSSILPRHVVVTARKGTFGHGMSAGAGWELTAQYLGYQQGALFPTPLKREAVHPEIAALHDTFVLDHPCPVGAGVAGKLSLGIGGINACVMSRPWG